MIKKINLRVISCLTAVMLVMASVMIAPIEISAEKEYSSFIANGRCGDNLSWILYENGTLTVRGKWDMWNFYYEKSWQDYSDKIKSVEIEDGVSNIGAKAFEGCEALMSVTLSDSVTKIGNDAFSGCSALTDIVFPDRLAVIGISAFQNCISLESINIPSYVSSIEKCVFKGCSALRSVTLSDGVMNIDEGAFGDCNALENIYVDEDNPYYTSVDGVLYTKDKRILICCPAGKKEVKILDGVTDIKSQAFFGCRKLTSISIPDGVTGIGDEVFYRCVSLTDIKLPNSLTSIGDSAFFNCINIKSIRIPEGVTKIGIGAFGNCSWLKSVTIPKSLINIEKMTFESCRSLESVKIPHGVRSIGYHAFSGCWALEEITIPYSVTQINREAFKQCKKLVIYGGNCSDAQDYAENMNIPFRLGAFIKDHFFLDVNPRAWYFDELEYVLESGLFNGVSPKMFAPDVSMNRAMLVTVLWRMEGEPAVSGENPFSDVPSGEWYTDAVKWAAENSIVYGISEDQYDPTADITREQAAAILYRYSQYKEYDVEKSADLAAFPDGNDTSDYAVTELSWAYAEGLITGVKKGNTDYLEPQGSATRAQVASILMRYKNNLAK